MKKSMLRTILCCMLILVSIVFCGCSNVHYVNYTDENGVYTEMLEITLVKTKFENLESAKQDITNAIKSTLESQHSSYTADINAKINEIKNDPKKQDLCIAYNNLLDDISWNIDEFNKNNSLVVKLQFQSKTSYLFFYDISNKNFSKKEINKGLFYNKIYFKGNLNHFMQNSLYQTLKSSIYLKKYFNIFDEEDVNLTYSYLAGSSRYKSNADSISYAGDGYYSHTWNVDINNPDKEIYFSVRLANRWIWYVLAIGISLIVCFILVVIALILKIKNRPKQEKNPMDS